jgi:hypothetical protein
MPGLKSSPPGLKLILLALDAADEQSRNEVLLPVLHTFIRFTGDRFAADLVDPKNANRLQNLTKQLYPYSLRTVVRGFMCSFLCGMHGLLFDGSDGAVAIRAQLDTYLNFATYDVRARNKVAYDPPPDAGEGCIKVWTYVKYALPDTAKFESELDVEEPGMDPVKAAPIKWNLDKVEIFLAFALVIMGEQRATGKVRKIPKGLYSLPSALVEYLPDGVVNILRTKGDFSRFGKIVPPSPRGVQVFIEPRLANIMYTTYPGGYKKSGPIENPFGTAKGYDDVKRKARAAFNKAQRHAQRRAAQQKAMEPKKVAPFSLLDGVLATLGRKRRAPELSGLPVAHAVAVAIEITIDGGDKKRPATAVATAVATEVENV